MVTVGELSLPVEAAVDKSALGDPLLDKLLEYFAAVLVHDVGDAWNARAGAGNNPLVKRVFAHNPGDKAFREATAPALYLWRDRVGKARNVTAGWRIRPSRLVLQWVPPTVTNSQDRRRIWEPVFNALSASLDSAVETGRHPGWKVDGDEDPLAETEGSLLWDYVKLHKLEVVASEAERAQVTIPMEGGTPNRSFEAFNIPIDLEERIEPRARAELAHVELTNTPMPVVARFTEPDE